MELRLRQIVLYSNNISKLSAFLSDLLDLEVIPKANGVYLENDYFCFLIKDVKKTNKKNLTNTVIDLHVSSLSELYALIKKIEFIQYRLEMSENQSIEVLQDDNLAYFEASDPDLRVWRFSTKQ